MRRRLVQFDGLRGIAALCVVCFHLMSAFAPSFVPAQFNNAHIVAYTPVAVLWNGTFAVAVFFVLSGFVVTDAAIARRDSLWMETGIRFLRLAVPALLSVIFAWLLLSLVPTAGRDVAEINKTRWFDWTYQGSIPSFLNAIQEGSIGVFVSGSSKFNNVLWTMQIEFIGSILCFIVARFKNVKARSAVILAAGFLCLISHQFVYEGFVLGMMLRELWAAGRLPNIAPLVALMIGLVIGSLSGDAAHVLHLGQLPASLAFSNKGNLLYPLAAGLVVYAVLVSQRVSAFLERRPFEFLGKISFPLYLAHVPIICTVGALIYLRTSPSWLSLLVIVTIPVAMVLAYLAEKYVEQPFLKSLSSLRRALRG